MKTKRIKKRVELRPVETLSTCSRRQATQAFTLWLQGETPYAVGLYLDIVDNDRRVDKARAVALIDAGRYLFTQGKVSVGSEQFKPRLVA